MSDELWRVQLETGEVRLMTLDALDRAFDEGVIDGRALVLAPGASAWTTLGAAAGLEAESAVDATPSLSPVALSNAAPSVRSVSAGESAVGLDLPDELRPRRRGLVIGGAVVALAVAAVLTIGIGKVGATHAHDLKATNAVQAPPAAVPLPTADPAKDKPQLTDEQRKKLLDADKARGEKARAKSQEKAEKAENAQKRSRAVKSGPVFVNGGDRFDPLNGKL